MLLQTFNIELKAGYKYALKQYRLGSFAGPTFLYFIHWRKKYKKKLLEFSVFYCKPQLMFANAYVSS